MTPELTQALLDRLDALAAKLGTTIDHLWPALYRFEAVQAASTLVLIGTVGFLAAAALIFAVACLLRGNRIEAANRALPFGQRQDDPGAPHFVAAIVCFIATVLLTVGFLGSAVGSGVKAAASLAAPEAAAVRAILENR